VHIANLAFRAGHREAAAEAVVPQVRLLVAFEDLADGTTVSMPDTPFSQAHPFRSGGP
jgi:hypothetical protein